MSFQEFQLDPTILSGVKAVGYTTPTPIQQQAIPSIMEGKDLLGLAQTGTGKTAAFALPILHNLVRNPGSRKIRVLIVSPTRELAEQILSVHPGAVRGYKQLLQAGFAGTLGEGMAMERDRATEFARGVRAETIEARREGVRQRGKREVGGG